MRIAAPVPRWAVSFADLGLLLIGCFVMLHAMEVAQPKAGAATAPSAPERAAQAFRAQALFEPGEARLIESAVPALRAEGRRWAGRPIRIVSRGAAEGSVRLDRFELAAARSAAVARVLRDNGVREGDIEIRVESAWSNTGQTLSIIPR
jgi:flagellar motor protein MotB